MKRFVAIEGLRAWLAWTVVISHVARITNIYAYGVGRELSKAGDKAVLIFIVISGFVITHLLLSKQEPYAIYITRRFFRTFPLFAVTCFVGYFAAKLLAQAIVNLPWGNEEFFTKGVIPVVESTEAFFWEHTIAHATMLHGALSTAALPASPYAFNGPGWSSVA